MSPSSKIDPRYLPGRKPVYRWNPSEVRWQMWNGLRWVRSSQYATKGEDEGPRLTMTYQSTISDLQEIS